MSLQTNHLIAESSGGLTTRLHSRTDRGFTIVELLIVIVVIGILAAITIVAYNGIQKRATGASLQADLKGASKQLALYQVDNGAFPTSNDCSTGATPAPPKICLKSSPGNSYTYTYDNAAIPQTFNLKATNGSLAYVITHDSAPLLVAVATSCPTGFIVVPGSATYGTSDFCVMKYDASQVGATTTPISQAGTTPWVSISQTAAIANSPNVAGCTGCHLITEPEYLTIAQNVLSVTSNWSGGAVGSGFIYSGHSDNAPANALAADNNDANGYAGTGNSSPSNQRRTLTLTNGEVIWDIAGNVVEWTSGTVASGGQPGITGESALAWKEWTAVTRTGTLSPNASPTTTGLSGASTWNSTNGIGKLMGNSSSTNTQALSHGGGYVYGANGGIMGLMMGMLPSDVSVNYGFRVAR